MIYLYNPKNGAPIKNWNDGQNRWTLDVDEVKAFPEKAAELLSGVYGFLRKLTEDEAETMLEIAQSKKVEQNKVVEGIIVSKTNEEIAVEEEVIKKAEKEAKEIVAKIKKAPEAEPSKPKYEELNRGDLISECHKRKIEIKGLGRSYVSKEHIIQLLENDDASK